MYNILFWFLILACTSILFLLSQNVIYATLLLILMYIITAILLIALNIPYLGLIFLMVYVGAIAILFLFVVMMLPLKTLEKETSFYVTTGILLFSFCMLGFWSVNKELFYMLNFVSLISNNEIQDWETLALKETNAVLYFKKLGFLLFNGYFMYLIIAGLVLLVSMVGAIFLTNEKQGITIRKQSFQLDRLHMFNCSFIK